MVVLEGGEVVGVVEVGEVGAVLAGANAVGDAAALQAGVVLGIIGDECARMLIMQRIHSAYITHSVVPPISELVTGRNGVAGDGTLGVDHC